MCSIFLEINLTDVAHVKNRLETKSTLTDHIPIHVYCKYDTDKYVYKISSTSLDTIKAIFNENI